MKFCVRAAMAALSMLACAAQAQEWPARPVRFVVSFAPGGPVDIVARLVGAKISGPLGQQIVVENRAGAGGNIGAIAVAKSAPDGYSVLVTSSAIAVNATLYANPGYDAERDFVPVVIAASQPNMIVVTASAPAKTLRELIEQSRGKKIAFASPGVGTTPHLTGENLLRIVSKLDVAPVHFRGAGQAVVALVGGEPPLGCMAISGPLPHIKSGKLRALAVSSAKRVAALPDVPTFAESGFAGMEDYTWVGVFAPAGTPAPIVRRLNAEINRALQSEDVRSRLVASAFDIVGGEQADAAAYLKSEVGKWGKVVRATGAKAD